MIRLSDFRRDHRGGSAVEFALVVPLFLFLILAVIYLSLTAYSAVQLHYATQWTARCLAVSANNPASAVTDCPAPATGVTDVSNYGLPRYTGPRITPTFTLQNATTCTNSKQVVGQGSFRLPLGFVNLTVPLTAKACFPYSPATT